MTTDATVEIRPGIRRIALPLGENPLGTINAYLITSSDGPVLIDTGWQTTEALEALRVALARTGRRLADLHQIVLTHGHPDHIGQAALLRAESKAPIALHPADCVLAAGTRDDFWAVGAGTWLRQHGLPTAIALAAEQATRQVLDRVPPFTPDHLLEDGERLTCGSFVFTVIWSPGHAPGQICLYEERTGLLVAGDHVLPSITPNIGLTTASGGDPLRDYLTSLARVRDLPVTLVLPGHGTPFTDLAGRVETIVAHHTARLTELLGVFGPDPLTAYELANRLTWAGGRRRCVDLPPFQQSFALAETIAHLEFLLGKGQVTRGEDEEGFRYTRAARAMPIAQDELWPRRARFAG